MFPSRSPEMVLAGVLGALILLPATVQAKPCGEHKGERRAACMEHRAKQAYPPNPTWAEITSRASASEVSALRIIAECEQPGSGSHSFGKAYGPRPAWRTAWGINAGATYVGAFGMYRGTYRAGQAATNYPAPPAATPAQEFGVALAVMRRFGASAWGCWR